MGLNNKSGIPKMKLSLLLAGAAALIVALPAAATPRAKVAFNDLDFSKPADVATFNARLDAAAEKACRNEAKMILNGQRQFVRCDTLVKEEALARMPEASRTALAAGQSAGKVAVR